MTLNEKKIKPPKKEDYRGKSFKEFRKPASELYQEFLQAIKVSRKDMDLKTFVGAWDWLSYHPIFNQDLGLDDFQSSLDIMAVKCHPKLHRICKDEKLNTGTEVWLECGPALSEEEAGIPKEYWTGDRCGSHDLRLDCGAPTFELAIIKLSKLVLKHYGDYDSY